MKEAVWGTGEWIAVLVLILAALIGVSRLLTFVRERRSGGQTWSYAVGYRDDFHDAPTQRYEVPQRSHPIAKAQQNVVVERPQPLSVWWRRVNETPIHIMLVGETQSGKTTTTLALLASRATTDKIVIIDPHEKFNPWPLPTANHGRDFDEIERIMLALHREFERRYAPGEPVGEPITVFIDELPAIVKMKPKVMPLVLQWLREAAKAKFRLVLLTQDPNVKTLGIEGEGEARKNLIKVLLGSFAVQASAAAGEAVQYGERPAALEMLGKTMAVSVRGVKDIATDVIPLWAEWRVPAPPQQVDGIVAEIAGFAITNTELSTPLLSDPLSGEKPNTDPFCGKTPYDVLAILLEEKELTSETRALAKLGITASSTSPKYAEAKRLLSEARGRVRASG